MEENLKHLSINDEKEEVVPVKNSRDVPMVTFDFCIVGMFLTYNSINFQNIKFSLADLWHPIGGVAIMKLEAKRYLFYFFNSVDFEWIVGGGPWLFNIFLLVWKEIQGNENSLHIPLTHFDFWIWVKDLPPGYYNETMAKLAGNFVGAFKEYDTRIVSAMKNYPMRVKVSLDIILPLKHQ